MALRSGRALELAAALAAGVRGLAAKARGRGRGKPVETSAPAADLRATMRKLAFMVHPDRFSDSPVAASENAESLALLQGLLSTVQKSRDSHPPAGVRTLRFHVHAAGGGTRVVTQVLRTTGGDCRRVVERSLCDLFGQLGLPREFRWGDGDWDVLSGEERAARDNRGDTTSDEAAAQEAAAPEATTPPAYDAQAVARSPKLRDASGAPQDLAAALAGLDPLLQAAAAVPWLPLDAEGAERRHYIIHHVIRELAAAGWALERGCLKVWQGARDADALAAEEMAAGVDAASAQALKMVVYHTRKMEAELGPAAPASR